MEPLLTRIDRLPWAVVLPVGALVAAAVFLLLTIGASLGLVGAAVAGGMVAMVAIHCTRSAMPYLAPREPVGQTTAVSCRMDLLNGDAMGRLEVGDMAYLRIDVTNTSSVDMKILGYAFEPEAGSADTVDCDRLPGAELRAGQTISCTASIDTRDSVESLLSNVFSLTVECEGVRASSSCRAPLQLYVIPAMECALVDIVDPVYVHGTPDDANRSCTTILEWAYVNQRYVVQGVVFRWEVPVNLTLRNGPTQRSVDVSAAPHFNARDLRFSRMSRDGIEYQVIEVNSAMPIPEEGQGTINIHATAAEPGLATTHGFWRFRGYEEWRREVCNTTVAGNAPGLTMAPSIDCSFVSIINPVFVSGKPADPARSSTTILEWTYVGRDQTVESVSFRWEVPRKLILRKGQTQASVDLSGAPHFNSSDLRFSETIRDGIDHQVIEVKSATPIPEEGQGTINIHVIAVETGLATCRGLWCYRDDEEPVYEVCNITVG